MHSLALSILCFAVRVFSYYTHNDYMESERSLFLLLESLQALFRLG